MRRNKKPCTLLVGMYNTVATKKSNIMVPKNIIPRITISSCNSASKFITKITKMRGSRDICAQIFIPALFTTTKEMYKQPRCPSTDEWVSKMCDMIIKFKM